MNVNKYQEYAKKTMNPTFKKEDMLINGVMGLCGEAGEVIDHVKKHLHQGHPLDKQSLILELGDVCWYIAELATALDVEFEEILDQNINKLKKRYPDGFETEKSISRQ